MKHAMQLSGLVVVAAMLFGFGAAGCQEHKPQPWQTPAQLQSRLGSARAINDGPTRDRALHDIAVDAAASSVGQVSIAAVSEIADKGVRDDACEQAGKILDERGDRTNASQVVQQMSDVSRRDKMLAYLASHAPSSR
jgi:hypothetical protein